MSPFTSSLPLPACVPQGVPRTATASSTTGPGWMKKVGSRLGATQKKVARATFWSSHRRLRRVGCRSPLNCQSHFTSSKAETRNPLVPSGDISRSAISDTQKKVALMEMVPTLVIMSAAFYFSGTSGADAQGVFADAQGAFDGTSGDDYVYTTKDLAVDLASPLVAYKVVSAALKQDIPDWLNYIIYAFTAVAIWVCVADVDNLDKYLQ